MKKLLLLLALSTSIYASDALNIDTLFKKQIGLRSITNLSLTSSGNPNTYSLYPTLNINSAATSWEDTKQLTLSQTFIYTITPKIDILVSGSASGARNEYFNYNTLEHENSTKYNFDALWLGFIYTFDSIAELIPQVRFQSAIVQRQRLSDETKNFWLKSQNLEFSLKGYSDPVVYGIKAGYGYNQKRKFNLANIEYGNSFYFGGDLSIVLSPKISLDLGIEQRFQTAQKINDYKNTDTRSLPTYSVGATYSINSDTALGINSSFGGSSAAPDAVFGMTLWKKF